ncbi:hypothetical protein NDU88_005606 [Pleurodeles waltl]|uniref:Uncharacterized protein n=1 Tax=Pleurodeles waltl TaxID=8319 RepID=A0AAV7MBG3_PLEWA|nr:hypothetical protein NDU88_005606 [Pleurodeles waltl]
MDLWPHEGQAQVPPSNRGIPVLLTQEGLPDNRGMLHNLALRCHVPFLQEEEAGDGRVAAVDLLDSEDEEAEDEDKDCKTAVIQQYIQ